MGYEGLMLPSDILNDRIYVHYQRDNSKLPVSFDPKLMNTHLDIPVRYLWAEKPSPKNFGLWASHVDAKFGWKDWATGEDFTSCEDNQAMYFKFRPGARIIFVDSVEKLDELPMIDLGERFFREKGLDWESIVRIADGLEIIFSSDWRLRDRLWSWDCDSIITWNPYVITPCGVAGDILDGFNEKLYEKQTTKGVIFMDNANTMSYEYFMSEYGHWHKASDGYPRNPGWYWFASIITDAEGKKQFDIYSDRIYVGVDTDELYLKDNFQRYQTLDRFMQLNKVSYWAYAFIPHAVSP